MKLDLLLTPRAEADLDDYCVYLAENADLETALRFYDAASATFQSLREMPFIGAEREYLNPVLSSLRLWFVSDFDHCLIFYRILDAAIQIVRVLHSSRDIDKIIGEEMAK